MTVLHLSIHRHGLVVTGGLPLDQLDQLDKVAGSFGWGVIDPGLTNPLTRMLGVDVTMVIGSRESLRLWRAEIDAWNQSQGLSALGVFASGPDCGISAATIILALTGEKVGPLASGHHPSPPRDPSDFGRCLRLLEAMPDFRFRLGEVARRWPDWAGLVAAWDELASLYAEELPTGRAPRTFARMNELSSGSQA